MKVTAAMLTSMVSASYLETPEFMIPESMDAVARLGGFAPPQYRRVPVPTPVPVTTRVPVPVPVPTRFFVPVPTPVTTRQHVPVPQHVHVPAPLETLVPDYTGLVVAEQVAGVRARDLAISESRSMRASDFAMARLERQDAENRNIQAQNNYVSAYSQLGAATTDAVNKQEVLKEARSRVATMDVDLKDAKVKVHQRDYEHQCASGRLLKDSSGFAEARQRQTEAKTKVEDKEKQFDSDKFVLSTAEIRLALAKATLRDAQAEEQQKVIDFGLALEKSRQSRETATRAASQATQAEQQSIFGKAAANARCAATMDCEGLFYAENSHIAATAAQTVATSAADNENKASEAQQTAEEKKKNAIAAVDAATKELNICSDELKKAAMALTVSEAALKMAQDEKEVADNEVIAMEGVVLRDTKTAERQAQLFKTATQLEDLFSDTQQKNLDATEQAERNLDNSFRRHQQAREEFIRRAGDRGQAQHDEQIARFGAEGYAGVGYGLSAPVIGYNGLEDVAGYANYMGEY